MHKNEISLTEKELEILNPLAESLGKKYVEILKIQLERQNKEIQYENV